MFIGQGTLSPPHHCAFRSTTLSYTILVQLAYIPCSLTSHCKSVQGWRTMWPMYNWVTSIPPPDRPGNAYARMPSCPCDPRTLLAWVDFRSTPTVAKTLEQVLPRRCHSTVCPSYGLVVIVSEDSSRRWSGDVCPDTPSSVSVTESRCNLAQCILDFT